MSEHTNEVGHVTLFVGLAVHGHGRGRGRVDSVMVRMISSVERVCAVSVGGIEFHAPVLPSKLGMSD
jgi:hypothetical protein